MAGRSLLLALRRVELRYPDPEPLGQRDVKLPRSLGNGAPLIRRVNCAQREERVKNEINAPAGHLCSPLGIAGRPDQSSIEPGASFQFAAARLPQDLLLSPLPVRRPPFLRPRRS